MIQEEANVSPATRVLGLQDNTAATSASSAAQPYVSEASILLAEKQNARGKQAPQVTLLSSSRVAHSSSMDQIAVSDVNAPTYWKSNSSSSKKKSKAVKAVTTTSKKLRLKYEKAESYADKQQQKKQNSKKKR